MAVVSTIPTRVAPLLLAALLLALQAVSAQTLQARDGSGEDSVDAVEAPALPEPLTRQAIREVLSGRANSF